jgi:alcohol dehydrogenase (cytochrome c)
MVAASNDSPTESRAVVIDVRPADLLASPPGQNWPSYSGDSTGRRFGSLSQINLTNIAQLRAQWVFQQFQPTGSDADSSERRHVRDLCK